MCVSCGCNVPNDDHGDERNITLNDLQEAGQAAGIPLDDVLRNIEEAELNQGDGKAKAMSERQRTS
jgi:hypothetical protein